MTERPERFRRFDGPGDGRQQTSVFLGYPQEGLGLAPGKRQPGQGFLNNRLRERVQQGHTIDDPWRRQASERESGMPCDGLFDGVQELSETGRPFQSRVNKLKQIEVCQPREGFDGLTFRQHVKEFSRESRRGEAVYESHSHGFRHQNGRVPIQLKPQALFIPDGAEHAGRVVDEAETVQHANGFVLQIPPATVAIHQFTETRGIEPNGQGIDREIPAADVLLDGTPLHRRECGRRVIRFRSSRGHVECVPVRERHDDRTESFMGGDAGLVSSGDGFGKTNPIAFDDQIQVKVRDAQEEVSDEPAYGMHADVTSLSECTRFLQEQKKR